MINDRSLHYVSGHFCDKFYVAIILALVFIFTKNNALINVGFGLAALVGAYGLVEVICIDFYIADLGCILMLVASIIYAVFLIISFFGYVKGDTCEDGKADVAHALSGYKEMETNGIITKEEFETLKTKVLPSAKVDTLSDLKKWKKLLDQKVITEEEFVAIKAKTSNLTANGACR